VIDATQDVTIPWFLPSCLRAAVSHRLTWVCHHMCQVLRYAMGGANFYTGRTRGCGLISGTIAMAPGLPEIPPFLLFGTVIGEGLGRTTSDLEIQLRIWLNVRCSRMTKKAAEVARSIQQIIKSAQNNTRSSGWCVRWHDRSKFLP
jgi:hypothetical protein